VEDKLDSGEGEMRASEDFKFLLIFLCSGLGLAIVTAFAIWAF